MCARGTGTAHRIAEGSVVGRSELRRVSHNSRLFKIVVVECRTDRSNATIHHVGGSDNIDARLGSEHGHLGQYFNCGVIRQILRGGVPETIVTVHSIRIERQIGNHSNFRHLGLDCTNRTQHQRLGV